MPSVNERPLDCILTVSEFFSVPLFIIKHYSVCFYLYLPYDYEPLQTISQKKFTQLHLIGIWYQVICVMNRLREELPLVMVYKTTMSTVKNHTRLFYFILYKKYLEATLDKLTLTSLKYCKQYCIIHLALSNTLTYY